MPSLQLKFSQHLTLTPQLQQSIRLLQLSTLELNQELEPALSDNPLLERLDAPLAGAVRLDAGGGLAAAGVGSQDANESGATVDTPPEPDGPERDEAWGEEEPGWSGSGGAQDADDDRSARQIAGGEGSLRDHLASQLAATRATPVDRALVGYLIDNLDEDGRLDMSLEEVHASLPSALEIEPEAVSAALRLLQSFDPPGVGARDLPECLLLQLEVLAREDHPPPADTLAFARTIVHEHLQLLATRDFTRLRRALQCDDAQLRAAQELIQSLSPRPGAAFSSDEPAYVMPDVVVRRTRSGWQATLNGDALPKLRINEAYAKVIRRNRAAGGLSAQLQEARWLVRNLQQRHETILRVSQAIVERQQAFFSHGAVGMRPLVLREIADTLGLHESTISRVTTQKYMLTPHGTLELKYFFGSHVSTDTGGAASSTAIRALIRQMIEAEDARSPLSDNRIADLLGEQGIVVARRTVAKYRETSNIPPAAQRKAL